MGEYSEVDVAKTKHAVAIAEGGRTGEVRFLGEVENRPLRIARMIKRLSEQHDRLHVCFRWKNRQFLDRSGLGTSRARGLPGEREFPLPASADRRFAARVIHPAPCVPTFFPQSPSKDGRLLTPCAGRGQAPLRGASRREGLGVTCEISRFRPRALAPSRPHGHR
jgi:hypothetical protein